MKRFLTVFPLAENVHLIKDVGMIPFILHKEFGYDATLASYDNGNYGYLSNEVQGLKHVVIKRIFNNQLLDVCLFLLLNFRKYDVLQVYHLKITSMIWLWLFKLLKINKGKTYLKLDADSALLRFNPSGIKKGIALSILRNIDLITVETKTYLQILNDNNTLGRKVEYCPNGFYDNGVKAYIATEEKENLMITVGRIGTTQKATETLCEGFRLFALSDKNWKLEVIGPIEPAFHTFIDDYFSKYPELKAQVSFLGEINDRGVLKAKYRNARIFVLTSRWEGFPLVFPEALKAGCFIVSSELPASIDVVDEGRGGLLFPVDDAKELAKSLSLAVANEDKLKAACLQIQDNAYKNFYWPEIGKRIAHFLF